MNRAFKVSIRQFSWVKLCWLPPEDVLFESWGLLVWDLIHRAKPGKARKEGRRSREILPCETFLSLHTDLDLFLCSFPSPNQGIAGTCHQQGAFHKIRSWRNPPTHVPFSLKTDMVSFLCSGKFDWKTISSFAKWRGLGENLFASVPLLPPPPSSSRVLCYL